MNSILPKTQSYWQPLSFASSLQWFCGVREGTLEGTLLWCVILHPSPLSNHCCMWGGRDGIFDKVFFHKATEIGTASCFGMLFAPPPRKGTLAGFCILHTTSCDSCSSRGRQKGNQYCQLRAKTTEGLLCSQQNYSVKGSMPTSEVLATLPVFREISFILGTVLANLCIIT